MKILLVEDQDLERRRTKELLETNGFVIDEARSAEEALNYARVYDYDAGIVDLHLTSPPTRMEGLELIRDVRRLRRAYFPILVLTLRDDIETEVTVFEAGANEFISKPLLPKVLLIRLHAMIQAAQRRSQMVGGMTLEHGPITLDIIRAEVRVEGEKVYLGPAEFRLLKYLIGPAEFRLLKYLMMTGRAVSTTELINHLWDSDSRADESNVYNLVSRVRRLLDPQKKLDPIRNIREISGYGLRDFAAEVQTGPS